MTAPVILLLLRCLSNEPELCPEAATAARGEPGGARYVALADAVQRHERKAQ